MMEKAATTAVVLFLLVVAAANLRCVPPAASAVDVPDWLVLLATGLFVPGAVFGVRWLSSRRQRSQSEELELVDRCRRHGL